MGRPGAGGMMPGMPGARKMPGMPGIDNDNWETARIRSMPRGGQSASLVGKSTSVTTRLLPQGSGGVIIGKSSALLQGSGGAPLTRTEFVAEPPAPVAAPIVVAKPLAPPPTAGFSAEILRKKTVSLLEEYFGIKNLDEALVCVEELKAPSFHPEFVKEAVCLALEKGPPIVEPIVKLFEHLCNKKVISAEDIATGCLLYAPLLEDLGIDFPRAPPSFGEILGGLVLSGCVDFKIVKEAIEKVGPESGYQSTVFNGVMRVVDNGSPNGQVVLESQASDVNACRGLL